MLRTKNKLLLMAITASGLAFGLLVDIAFARIAGASNVADNIVVALTIPFVIDTILREGARYSIISIIQENEENGVVSELIAVALLSLASAFLVAIGIFAWPLAGIKELHESIAITLLSASTAGLFAFTAFLSATADAKNLFMVSSSRNILVHSSALIVFLLLHEWTSQGTLQSALTAYFIGAIVYTFFVACVLMINGILTSIKLPTKPTLISLKNKFLPSLINVGAGQGMRISERGFLLMLPGGAVFLFYIAFRIFASLQSLIGGTLATLAMRSNKSLLTNVEGFKKALTTAAVQASIYAIPCVAVIFFWGKKIIETAYGNKLTTENIETIYEIANILSFVIYFQALNVIVTTFWLGRSKTFLMNVVPVLVLLFSVPAFWISSKMKGIIGIANVTAAAVVASLVLNIIMLYVQIKKESKALPQ